MSWQHYTYLLLNLGTLAYPLAQSFERRLRYYQNWKYLWPGILANGAFFLAWDVFFTRMGVWSFNNDYLLGTYILNLPVEEWLFFITVPFACVFIYECVKYFFGTQLLKRAAVPLALGLAAVLAAVALANTGRWYTGVKLGSTALFLVLHVWVFGNRYFGTFFVAYLFTLLPFALVNGTLTYLPVVRYNDAENLGIRLRHITGIDFLNIPVEDTVYSLLMLLITVSVYEFVKERRQLKTVSASPAFLSKPQPAQQAQ